MGKTEEEYAVSLARLDAKSITRRTSISLSRSEDEQEYCKMPLHR